ncbi:MAG TPA: hypothetical protein VG477_07155 [Thermoanaerobaculia bacterium]|nr:hypothetical protein [Thermoanaerobaculia bacterium]
MFSGSRKLLLKFSFLVAMVVLALSVPTQPAFAQFCTFDGDAGEDCLVQGCYDQVYCRAIACFQRSWANGGDGSECCFHNFSAQFCGSSCPLFC